MRTTSTASMPSEPEDDATILRRYGIQPVPVAGWPKDLEAIAELEALLVESERFQRG